MKFAARFFIFSAAVALFAVVTTPSIAAPTLKVGSTAPSLPVAKWVKGTPITKFDPNKIYVVEFWATWCVPCKMSIPHITELAKKYLGKITFTGISISENRDPADAGSSAYIPKVVAFVQNMGSKMAYNVAIDGPKSETADAWMNAAQQETIPSAFVVDHKKIVWIGRPMEMDDVLSQVVAGKFDAAAAERKRAADEAERNELNQNAVKASDLIRAGNVTEADKILDTIVSQHPQLKLGARMMKFSVLLKYHEDDAYKLAKTYLESDLKDNPDFMSRMAWMIVTDAKLKSPDYKLALTMAERGDEVTKHEEPQFLDVLAAALAKNGRHEEAVATQQKVVELINKPDSKYPPEAKKQFEDHLAQLKAQKK